ncbi:MAG: site-specific integrase [Vicinamibacterales bacterium]
MQKHHNRACLNRGGKPTNCGCPWYGYYKGLQKGLAQWSGRKVDPRSLGNAQEVLNRLRAAIDEHRYDPAGEERSLGSGQRFSEFVKEWQTHYAEPHNLTSTSLASMLDVLSTGLGVHTLEHLAGAPLQIERWLNKAQKDREWSDNTWNRYYELLTSIFNRAVKWRTGGVSRMAVNPMTAIEKRTGAKKKFETRLEEDVEKALIDACDQLNRPQHQPHTKLLTWEKVHDLRRRAAEGEQQSKLAAEFGISSGLCCDIVKERVWSRALYKTGTKGDEMRRRVYAAFDLGLRHGEIVKVQLKHVDFKPIEVAVDGEVRQVLAIALPPTVTKGGKTTGETEYVYAGTERLKKELEKRRFVLKRNAEAYIFGTEAGKPVKNFKRMWRELFKLAGLTFGRDLGLTWHTIRHEFISRHIENTGDPVVTQRLARHKDNRTTQGYMHARDSRVLAAVVRFNR